VVGAGPGDPPAWAAGKGAMRKGAIPAQGGGLGRDRGDQNNGGESSGLLGPALLK
jgi:hypothetical protein